MISRLSFHPVDIYKQFRVRFRCRLVLVRIFGRFKMSGIWGRDWFARLSGNGEWVKSDFAGSSAARLRTNILTFHWLVGVCRGL